MNYIVTVLGAQNIPALPQRWQDLQTPEPTALARTLKEKWFGREVVGIDVVVQKEEDFLTPKKLALFDMDSTLVAAEGIDEMARLAGCGDKVAEITARAMAGELNYAESLKARVRLLKGLHKKDLLAVEETLPLMTGAANLVSALKNRGMITAVVSGGFTLYTERLQQRLGLDVAFGNVLVFDEEERVTGEVREPILDAAGKAQVLKDLAQKHGFSLKQCLAVGDGANDIPMLQLAGLGIAFQAKPAVQALAPAVVSQPSLESILCLLHV